MTNIDFLLHVRQASHLPAHLKRYILHYCCFLLAFFLYGSVNGQTSGCHQSLTHHFGYDEKESGAYLDYKGGAKANCTNCPTPVAGLFDGAQMFDGVNDGVKLDDVTAFEWGPNSDFTIELWTKTSANPSDNQILIGRRAKEHNMIWWIGMNKEGRAVFALFDNAGNGATIGGASQKKINDGRWHHIMVVRDGRTRESKLYVDGFITAKFVINYDNGSFDKSVSPVTMGYLELENGYHFQGALDEVMIYGRYALTEAEARARYNNGNGNYCGPNQVKPTIMSEAVTYGTVGQQYNYNVEATGSPAPTFTIVNGPQGLTIDSATGEISWGPTAPGSYKVTVKASNSAGEDQQTFNVDVKKSIVEVSGLLHHWMLNEGSASEYRDYYTPFHAKSVGASSLDPVKGVVSGGQHFDGKEDALDVTGSKNFDWEAKEGFTIELWMKTSVTSSGNRVLIGRQARDSPLHWWLGITKTGQARFVLFDIDFEGITTGVGDAGPRLDDGIWHQVVVARDGAAGSTKVYVDGEQVASGSFNHQTGFTSSSEINIGYLGGQDIGLNGYRYEGDMDEVKLFGRPLSADEIRQNYRDVINGLAELVKFEGAFKNGVVELDWESLNEVNWANFTVERSSDKETFEPIGEVKAAGNSTQLLAYNFVDEKPLDKDGYYRLKINRTDGTYTYSNIILISNRALNSTTFKVYPNPLKKQQQEVTVAIANLESGETIVFFISDLSGKRLMEQEHIVDADGRLTFTVPLTVTDRLHSGMYMLTLVTRIKTISRKLMVVH